MADLSQEIKTLNDACIDAFNRMDMDFMVDSYAEDCVFIPPGKPVETGRDAARKLFANFAKEGLCSLALETSEVVTFNQNEAVLRGTYRYSRKDGSIGEKGKHLLFKRVDGKLKYVWDMWSVDQ